MNWLQRFLGRPRATVPSRAVDTPEWMKKSLQLPPWAAVAEQHSHKVLLQINVDTGAAMTEWLALLGAPSPLTQYWIECAYQCVKMDVQMALAGTDFDPRAALQPAEFRFKRANEFALANFPQGPLTEVTVRGAKVKLRGVELATQGLEARKHYERIRGRLPF